MLPMTIGLLVGAGCERLHPQSTASAVLIRPRKVAEPTRRITSPVQDAWQRTSEIALKSLPPCTIRAPAQGFRNRHGIHDFLPPSMNSNSRGLTSIRFVNRAAKTALPSSPSRHVREKIDGTKQERRFKAGLRRDGSGEAARNRKQGRQSEPRRRAQGQRPPLSLLFRVPKAPGVKGKRPALSLL